MFPRNILLTSFVLVLILGATLAKKERSKPLALNLEKVKVQEEETNVVVENSEETGKASPKGKNATENINETIEETFELLDTFEKDEEEQKQTAVAASPRPAFIGQIKELLLKFVQLFGFVPTSNKRKHRNMAFSNETENVLDSSEFYQEQVRTTVGAVLGRPDCIKRAACRAGKYLKGIKGKEIILVIMEKVTPTKWQETYRVIKDSAVHSEECRYKCLED